jgi:hypothetical protein
VIAVVVSVHLYTLHMFACIDILLSVHSVGNSVNSVCAT